MTETIKKGLYYNYTITSQSYSAAKLINNNNIFNKLDIVIKLIDIIIGIKCNTGGDASFYTTNYYK